MLESIPIGIDDDPYHSSRPFSILPEARRRHCVLFGGSGAGKSSLLRNFIGADLAAGAGVTVVDPHGQLVQDILDHHVPKHRTQDVIYFDAKLPDHAFPVNVLQSSRPGERGLIVEHVVSIFRTLWRDSWGPRLEDVLRCSLYALIEQPTPLSLLAIPKLLTDEGYRTLLLRRVKNPVVLDFFMNTYNRWTPSFREEAISPVLNKCRAFLTDPIMSAVIGPAYSAFDFRSAMDRRKIILVNVSKGAIGEDNARLIGSLFVIKEKLAAFGREDIPEADRVPHVLYCEEAHNFIADFESILAESRKYRYYATLCSQGISNFPRETALAIFANCATIISFRVSSTDAEQLRDEFSMVIPASALQDLPDYKAYVRTLTNDPRGVASPTEPHLIALYPPQERDRHTRMARRETVIRVSNERYTKPRALIDRKLARFLQRKYRAKADPKKARPHLTTY